MEMLQNRVCPGFVPEHAALVQAGIGIGHFPLAQLRAERQSLVSAMKGMADV
ncbi:MAG: hypothetical protein II336_13250 [Loktanella sp.]|nr:hypothetical protein [Loktanella sp.]